MSRRGFADDVAPLIAIIVVFIGLMLGGWLFSDHAPPAPLPHVQSDCRAACTLEGMALAGVELVPGSTTGHRVACLCAPIESSPGGDL